MEKRKSSQINIQKAQKTRLHNGTCKMIANLLDRFEKNPELLAFAKSIFIEHGYKLGRQKK